MRIGIRYQVFGALLAAAALSLAAQPARADVIANTFGSGTTFTQVSWWDVGQVPGGGNQVVAFPFISSETATLTGATLALGQLSSTASPVNLFIESSVAGKPGVILDTLTQIGSFTLPSIVNFSCTGCSTLTAGTQYWIVGQQSNSSQLSAWYYSPTTTASWYYDSNGSATGPWSLADNNHVSAFDITGTPSTSPVPEPATLWLLASGMAGVLFLFHRRIHAPNQRPSRPSRN